MPCADVQIDQALGMKARNDSSSVRAVCIASGKGGVGKTHVTVNLGVALASQGKQVMVLDADLGMANVDVVLGLHAVRNLAHVLRGECRLEDIVLEGPEGVRVVPAGSGVREMLDMSHGQQAGLINAFSSIGEDLDYLLVDSPAGLSDGVTMFSRAAHDVVVVVCDEPASITDAYAVIKRLSRDHDVTRFHVLANRVVSVRHGWDLFGKVNRVASQFLDVTLDFCGAIPEDPKLRYAVQSQRSVVEAYPTSRSSAAFKRLAAHVEEWSPPVAVSGHLQFFLERSVLSMAR
jgi:flagellar biosynthesis protein FlhG